MISKILIPILSVSVIFYTCDEQADEPIEPQRFAEIYVELVTVSLDSTVIDSVQHQDTVLAEFDVSQQEFQETVEYYHQHPKLWLDVFTKVEEKLEERNPTKK